MPEECGTIIVSSQSGKRAEPSAAVRYGIAIGVLCAQCAWAGDEIRSITTDQSISASLAPGENHHYQIELRAGRNYFQLLEQGIDLALSVKIDDREYIADSPTARFALEQVWFDLATDSQATIVVATLRAKGVPGGDYQLAVESGYSPSPERRRAEQLTGSAVTSFNDSYSSDLTLETRGQLRATSLDTYIKAAREWEELGYTGIAAYCWHAAGFISSALLFEHGNAQSYLERAAQNYGAAELPEHKQVARKDVGQAILREERFSTAAAYLSEMVELSDHDSDRFAFIGGVANNDLCVLYKELGKFKLAISHCERALDAFSRIGDIIEYNTALHNLAIANWLDGDQNGAITLLYDLLKRHEAIGAPVRYAQTLSLLVDFLYEAGDIDAALSAYDQSIDIFEREGLLRWQASLLTKYSRIEQHLGRTEQARLHLERALALAKAENSPHWQGRVTVALAEMDLSAGRIDDAIRALQSAVGIFRQIQSFDSLVSATVALAAAQLQAGWPEQAMATIVALSAERELHADGLAQVQLMRARILAQQDKLDEAFATVRRATAGFEAIGNLTGQLDAVGFEAELLSQQERWDESLARLESMRVLVRRIGRTLVLPQLRARYYSQQQHFYEALIRAHQKAATTSDDAILRTLNVIEEARATALRAHLEAPSSWLESAPPDLRFQYDRARRNVGELVQESVDADGSDSRELNQALHDLERIQNRIWQEHSSFAELGNEDPITWVDVDQALDERTAILYVYIGGGEKFGMLLEKEKRTRYPIVATSPIQSLTRAVLDEFRTPNSRFGVRAQAAKELSHALLGPVAARLATIERLIVVPDAGLHSLPVSALPHPESSRPLVESHEITSIPSLRAVLRYETNGPARPPNYRVAAIGDPVTSTNDPRLGDTSGSVASGLDRLYGSSDELQRVRRVFDQLDVSLHTGFDADKSLFLGTTLAGVDILHIAAHGISSKTMSAKSGIFLSTLNRQGQPVDGHLGLADLFGLELQIPLVVLSGCETSLGEQSWSEGPIGIARAFQYSGVPNVVSTLWRIDDDASAILIEKFYKSLASGESVPAALRSAQLALMQSAEYRHPYYWAAYQSLGDWSLRWEKLKYHDAGIVGTK